MMTPSLDYPVDNEHGNDVTFTKRSSSFSRHQQSQRSEVDSDVATGSQRERVFSVTYRHRARDHVIEQYPESMKWNKWPTRLSLAYYTGWKRVKLNQIRTSYQSTRPMQNFLEPLGSIGGSCRGPLP